MNKIKDTIAKDLWVVLLDIIAVNLSYYLAFYFRFYVNMKLGLENAEKYKEAFIGFAPWYSLIAILIFAVWKLYGGLWRYAGVNDMNRIILANICTIVIYVGGTAAFFIRMPVVYYIMGAILQFAFVVITRFSYRILMVEKKKIANKKLPSANVMIVGSGELGRRVVRELEEETAFRPVCIIDAENSSEGRMLDGIPIIGGMESIESCLDKYTIQNLFIADNKLSQEQRKRIRDICEAKKVELQDYTGMISNQDDSISVTALLELTHCPLLIRTGDEEIEFENSRQALFELTDRYGISSITIENGRLVLELRKSQQVAFVLDDDQAVAYVGYDAWAKKE